MKVLYDLQAFLWTRYSGIPRYFTELIKKFNEEKTIETILPCCYCMNYGYQDLFPKQKKSLQWNILDKIFDLSQKYINKTPAYLLSPVHKTSTELISSSDYDVFHPTFFNSYFLPHLHGKPYVLTIHDLSLEIFPELSSLSNTTIFESMKTIKGANRFIADSKYTKKHFIEYYDIDDDLVDVIYLGPTFDKINNDNILENSLENKKYILYVNVRGGRKNFYAMISIIKDILIQENLSLICGGGGAFTNDEKIFFNNCNVEKYIRYVEIDDNKLKELYTHAIALIFPSIYEGFGIPILEAFACGCPVILSNASCFPEIGGDAAVYFDPKEPKSMREAIFRVISDEKLQCKMRNNGYRQLTKFSWEKCARETKIVYEKAILSQK